MNRNVARSGTNGKARRCVVGRNAWSCLVFIAVFVLEVNNHVLTETNRLFGGKYMKKIANHQTFAKISSIETLQDPPRPSPETLPGPPCLGRECKGGLWGGGERTSARSDLFFSHRNHRNHRKGFVYRGRRNMFFSHRNHGNHRKSYELKNFCDFCDFCVSKTIPAFPRDQTGMRKTQESSCSSVFVRGKIVGIRRVNRRFSVASAADCRNKVNGIVERNQWNC